MILLILILQVLSFQSRQETSCGPGEEPVFSPDGKTIAFRRSGEIWTLDLDSRQVKSLTKNSNSVQPNWSPDGKHIVFQSYGFGTRAGDCYSIWQIDRDGSHLRHLFGPDSITRGEDQCPLWSRDGGHIVWTHGSQIWIMESDGKNPRPLTTRPGLRYEYACDFSPDGNLMVYLAADDIARTWQIRILSLKDRDQTTFSKGRVALGVRWSHDGKHLFYNTGTEIMKIRTDASEEPKSVYRFEEGLEIHSFDITRDNKYIVYDDSGAERDGTIYVGTLH